MEGKVVPVGEEIVEVKNGEVQLPKTEPVETPKVESPKVEQQGSEEPDEIARLDEFQQAFGKVETPKPVVKQRDLTDIDEADQPLFRQMSNEAFEKAAAWYKERKELNKQLENERKRLADLEKTPKSWADHPEAYVLDPSYSENLQIVSQGEAELRHWKEQYRKIRQGEDWEDLEVKDGKLVKITRPPSADAEADILGYINNTTQAIQSARGAIMQLKDNFKQTHTGVVTGLREMENQYFPAYKEWDKVSKEDPYIVTMLNALGSRGLTNNILAPTVCKLYAALMTSLKAKSAQKAEAPKNPTASNIVVGSGATVDDDDRVSIEDFNKVLRR